MPADKLHEQGFNYALAAALRKCNPAWRDERVIKAERTGQSKRPDIVIEHFAMPSVVIEAAYGGDRGKDAGNRIADKKMDFETGIEVNIPFEFQDLSEKAAERKLEGGASIGYAVMQRGGYRFPGRQDYLIGSVHDLAAFIRVASVPKDHVEKVAEEVVELIRGAGGALSATLPETALNKISGLMAQRTILSSVHTTAVLWLDALLVHRLIAHSNPKIKPLPRYTKPVKALPLADEWRKILETNWNSIFEPAVQALETAGGEYQAATSHALTNLLKAVEILNTARLGAQINVGAELFPKISEDRKEAAAFYTLPATAELLASMTIRSEDRDDWHDSGLFNRIRVADFACGTGTLLRAAVHRVAQFHAAAGGDEKGLKKLYLSALENGVTGTDVSPIAAHLALSSVVLMGSGEPYGNTKIGSVKVGDPDRTGALEYLTHERMDNDLLSGITERAFLGRGNAGKKDNTIPAASNSFDYVLMNPPYSRTRGGQSAFDIADLSAKQRNACQKRWGELNRNEKANKKAGMAASFLCLASHKVKPGGRIGFVLPLTAAFAESWAITRAMLVTDFEEIIALTPSTGSQQSDISADTGMDEMLLVARKRRNGSGKFSSVLCVMPHTMPIRVGEAGEYGRAILRAIAEMTNDKCHIRAGKTELARAIRFTPVQPTDTWSHLGARNIDLSAIAHRLTQGFVQSIATGKETKLNCPMTTLGKLFSTGPTHHLIGHPYEAEAIGALTLHPVVDAVDAVGENRALWAAQACEQVALRVLPTHKGVVSNQDALQRISEKRGTLHYARGLRWTSQQLVAATTEYPVFGGRAWTTLLIENGGNGDDAEYIANENLRNAFALWANSTFGALIHWTQGSRTQLGRAQLQVTAIGNVPTPDLRKLPAKTLATAAAFFNKIADEKLMPVCQLHADSVRHEIDRAVAEMLGISGLYASAEKNAMDDLRYAWCSEPSVHGNNQAALALLKGG